MQNSIKHHEVPLVKREVLRVAKEQGISSIRVEFNGQGDSGEVYGPEFRAADGDLSYADSRCNAKTRWPLRFSANEFDREKNEWNEAVWYEKASLKMLVEALVESELDRADVDWYNNEGGWGVWFLNVDTNAFEFDIYQRYETNVHCECDGFASLDFPYEEIRTETGDFFSSVEECLKAGFAESQIWSVTEGDSEDPKIHSVFCYGAPDHFVNLLGYVCTQEHRAEGEYYEDVMYRDEEVAA